MRRKSERVKDKSAEKKVEKSPKKTRTRSTRRRKKSSTTSPESSDAEDFDPSFKAVVVNPDVVEAERSSGRTRRASKKQTASEELEQQAKSTDRGPQADESPEEVTRDKEETPDGKHKEKEGKSSMWQVKSADDSSGSEIKKLKLCIVRPQEPELSPRKRKKLSRSSHRGADEDVDESFARDSSGERRRSRRSLRNASDDSASPEKVPVLQSVKPKSGDSSEDGQRTQDSMDEIVSVSVDAKEEPTQDEVRLKGAVKVLPGCPLDIQATTDPLEIRSDVIALVQDLSQSSPVEGKFADSSDSESKLETSHHLDPFDALKSTEVAVISVAKDISGEDAVAASEETVFVSCDSTVELAKSPHVQVTAEQKPEVVPSRIVCDSSIEIQHIPDRSPQPVRAKILPVSEGLSPRNVPQKLPVARDSSEERAVSRDSSKERAVSRDSLKDKPVSQDFSKERPVSQDSSKESPVSRDSSKESPVSRDSLKESPVSRDSSKERPVSRDSLKESPVSRNSSKERPVSRDSSKERPASRDSSKESPVSRDSPKESPVSRNSSKEKPVSRDSSKERPVSGNTSEEVKIVTKPSEESVSRDSSEERTTATKPVERKAVAIASSEECTISTKTPDKALISRNSSEENSTAKDCAGKDLKASKPSDVLKLSSVSPEKSSREERHKSRRRHESPEHKHRHLNRGSKKEADEPPKRREEKQVAKNDRSARENEEKKSREKPREKISLKRSMSTKANDEADDSVETASSVPRKRRWGGTAKKPVLSISSDSLKNLMPEAKPLAISEIELAEDEEKEEGEVERDEEVKLEFPVVPDRRQEDQRVGQRTISLVGLQARSPSPPRHRPSAVLFITNLTRPFTVNQLKELLARTGTIIADGFWTNVIRSKCYVQYSSEAEAYETRRALHGVRWPVSNPKQLCVDFARREDLDLARVLADPGVVVRKKEPLPVEPVWERPEPRVAKVVAPVREWDLGKTELGVMEDPRERARSREKERRVRKERSHRSQSPREAPARKVKKEEDAPAKLLDDLFRKTKLTPCIYWLPLTAEQIVVKEEMRRKHMAEHQRRLDEMRKADKERMERMQGRRMNDRRRSRRRSHSAPKK